MPRTAGKRPVSRGEMCRRVYVVPPSVSVVMVARALKSAKNEGGGSSWWRYKDECDRKKD